MVHSQISQYFSVEIDAISGEEVHQPGVRNAIQTGTGIDTGNPEGTESALLAAAVAVGVPHSFVYRIFSYGIHLTAGTEVTLSSF